MLLKANAAKHKELVDALYQEFTGIEFPPEYAYFVKENMLMFLIRLARYKFVSRLIKKTDRVLEVGCGSGIGALFLSQHSFQVTGIDSDNREVQEAKRINLRENVSFVETDFFNYPAKNAFDVVVALDLIEHIPVRRSSVFIQRSTKHLRQNGMLIIGTPSRYSYPHQGKLSQAAHKKLYDQEELCHLLEKQFGRTIAFSMNDELVHTGFWKMAWYYFAIAIYPKVKI